MPTEHLPYGFEFCLDQYEGYMSMNETRETREIRRSLEGRLRAASAKAGLTDWGADADAIARAVRAWLVGVRGYPDSDAGRMALSEIIDKLGGASVAGSQESASKPELQIVAETMGLTLPKATEVWLEQNPHATLKDVMRITGKSKSVLYSQTGPWAGVRCKILKRATSGAAPPGHINRDDEGNPSVDGVHYDKPADESQSE